MKTNRKPTKEIYQTNQCCVICGATITRKTSRKGIPENYIRFRSRLTCGKTYNSEGKLVPTPCFKKWQEIPENNPNYKGLMHIPCSICGKQGLTYQGHGTVAKICGTCLLKNRPTPHNKQEVQVFLCKTCGKPCTDRCPNRKLKSNYKIYNKYCSQECYFNRKIHEKNNISTTSV